MTPRDRSGFSTKSASGAGLAEDLHHAAEELQRFGAGALEGVAPHDASEAPAARDPANVFQELVGSPRHAAGEDDNSFAVERARHDVPNAISQRLGRDRVLLAHLLLRGLLDDIPRRLD